MKRILRLTLMAAALAALLCALPKHELAFVFAASSPSITVDVHNAAPRQVEDSTGQAVARDYTAAWQTMTEALDKNRTDLLAANFVGAASDKLTATVKQQQVAGLHQRIVDKGHSVQAIFYSPEGSAMELRDTAHLQIELLDGDKVIHSEDATVHYIALLTAAENSWKVRVLEAVPSF
jgi:hypothetical protein